jgi:TPR repeat protein
MKCKICQLIRERLWERTDDWERDASNEAELWAADPPQARELALRAGELFESSPAAAFQLHSQAADAGSAWSMERLAWHYWTGTGVEANPAAALAQYRRAISAGSWVATLSCARLLAELGHWQEAESMLNKGVEKSFVPARYWLAWLRYERTPTSETCKQVRPLLESAARAGHPAARVTLASWMARGKLGVLAIPRDFTLLVREAVRQDVPVWP